MRKKSLRLLLCMGILAALMTVSAFAAAKAPESKAGDLSLDSSSGVYTAVFDEATPGEQYVLLVVRGEKKGDSYSYSMTSADNLLYIDQKAADSKGVVSFDFIPMESYDGVVLLGGKFSSGTSPPVRIAPSCFTSATKDLPG